MKRAFKTIGVVVLCLLVALGGVLALYILLPSKPKNDGMDLFTAKAFTSKKEVGDLLKEYDELYETREIYLPTFGAKLDAMPEDATQAPTSDGGNSTSTDFSSTNVQVEGIDEADVVKTDGRYLYVLNQSGVHVVSVEDGEMVKTGLISCSVEDFFIYENYVIAVEKRTKILIFDTQNKENPTLVRSVEHNGRVISTRLKDGVLYYVTELYVSSNTKETVLPQINVDDSGFKEQDVRDIYYFEGLPNKVFLTLAKIDLQTLEQECKSYLGAGKDLYMSENNLYVYSEDRLATYYTNGLRVYVDSSVSVSTRVLKFSIESLASLGGCTVEGTVKDKYCLDEYDGYFRIATTVGSSSYSVVTLFDESLKEVGKTDKIAKGEKIYSCRFNGDSASVVTFKQVDPLFKVDLSDPQNPTVSEGLKKDGVSYYLHFVEGTDYLIGLGRDTANGTMRGIELALFDNSGDDAEIINVVVIDGESADAEALTNPKAVLYDKERDLFGFSALVYDEGQRRYAQGYYLFGFMGGKIEFKKKILHDSSLDSRYEYLNDGKVVYNESYYVTRAVQIGDCLYSISSRLIVSHSIENELEVLHSLEI